MTLRYSTLLDRSQTVSKVRPELWGESHKDVDQWVDDAAEVQEELQKVLQVEEVVDPEFKRPPEADELAKEIQKARVWLESLASTLHPVPIEADFDLAPCPIFTLMSKRSEAKERTGKEPEVLPPVSQLVVGACGSLEAVEPTARMK
ncbi:hypothetical protein JB92DRAFT_2829652 [Gautieria morchelliformis]|nr:hypothetical protein JB92DRAFT_2829652 [Gautieria morchelliformis]